MFATGNGGELGNVLIVEIAPHVNEICLMCCTPVRSCTKVQWPSVEKVRSRKTQRIKEARAPIRLCLEFFMVLLQYRLVSYLVVSSDTSVQ